MLLKLIDDVNRALDAECYFAALSLAITFPDICGKAKYPKEKSSSKRYEDWYEEYVGKYEQCPCEHCRKQPRPYLSGEVVYNLRNSLLHQGTPNIDGKRIQDNRNKINHFEIVIESKKQFNIYGDSASIYHDSVRRYRVNVRRLCLILCSTVKEYYEANRDKFDFFHYSIIDWDAEVSKMHDTGM